MRSALEFVSVNGEINFAAPRVGTTAVVGGTQDGWSSRAFRMSIGLDRPTDGAVLVLGTDMSRARGGARRKLQRRLSVVFGGPDRGLFGESTVRDNIVIGVRAAGRTGRRGERPLVERTLADFDLLAVADARPGDLDGHGRDRLALARALALRSPLLVVEAFDQAGSGPALDELARLIRADRDRQGGACVLFMADPGAAGQLAHHVVDLDGAAAPLEMPHSDW